MLTYRNLAFAGVSLISLTTPAFAEVASKGAAVASADSNDIIVSARRKEERLQDVPKVVDAVTADDLRKNNIQKFEDVQTVVPGLNLQDSHNGLVQNASLRGSAMDVDSGLQAPTIQFYLNDANIQSNFMFQSMYDVGQVEVLRGPQGTLRGRSAPSGAITLSTKLPDLNEIGGFVQGDLLSGPGGEKLDYAVNAPIIAGKLAVRVAGTVSENEGSGVRPVNTSLYPAKPFDRTWSERISIRAQPIDSLEINLMYQRLVNRANTYIQTESTCLIDTSVSCGSGPLIKAGDRLSTINGQRFVYEQENIWQGRVDWHILGQKLSYVGSYALQFLSDEEPEDGANFFSPAFGANPYQKRSNDRGQFQSHEVRLASEDRIANIFEYVVGYNTVDSRTAVTVSEGVLPHSSLVQGNPFANGPVEVSWFGNLTVHPTDKMELSGGARYIIDKFYNQGFPVQRSTDTIWTASASYHFTPDIMAYANAGSSFRMGGDNLGLEFTPFTYGVFGSLPYPSQYFHISPEKSTSYEVGFKTQFLDHKLTLNLDYYHQDFTNYQYVGPDFVYSFVSGINAGVFGDYSAFQFVAAPIVVATASVPAKVDGVEGNFNYQFAPEGSIGGTFSYSDGRVKAGSLVPCNVSAGPTVSASNLLQTCPAGAMSINPRFNATLNAGYALPLNNIMTGFVRGQMTYHGATPTSPAFNPADHAPGYAVVNLYAGVRSPNNAWEVTAFVKNVFKNQTRLPTYGGNITAVTGPQSGYGPNPTTQGTQLSNYSYMSVVSPREVGITVRYSFGSR